MNADSQMYITHISKTISTMYEGHLESKEHFHMAHTGYSPSPPIMHVCTIHCTLSIIWDRLWGDPDICLLFVAFKINYKIENPVMNEICFWNAKK